MAQCIRASLMLNSRAYNKFTIGLAYSLMMMIIVSTAIADSPISQYSLRTIGEHSNPWALPQTPNSASGFQQMPNTWGQQYQGSKIEKYNRGYRFVTPEILESLKQQQSQNQMTPEDKQPLKSQRSIQNYSYPSLGMGYTNPLYGTPTVSPWSTDSNLLNSGDSFPMAPKEAIGGFSPFQVMPFSDMNGADESGNSNIFNPFGFGRYGNFQ